MKNRIGYLCLFLLSFVAAESSANETAKNIDPDPTNVSSVVSPVSSRKDEIPFVVEKIWDAAPHSAFTDLVRWNDKFYCAFRVGTGHVPGASGEDGRIQIIVSPNGKIWSSTALVFEEGIDLRDPKLSVTPDDRLMLLIGGSNYDGTKLIDVAPRVAFLKKGEEQFSKIQKLNIDSNIPGANHWLWRVTWHNGIGYGVSYQSDQPRRGLHLLKSTDGINYQLVKTFDIQGKPNETTIRFDSKDEMFLVVRNEDQRRIGHWGRSKPPYADWKWYPIKQRLGGPNLIQLPDASWLLGTRAYGKSTTTVLGRIDTEGDFKNLITFPSGGDTSYPGMQIYEDQVWFVYYSSHEGKSAIYLARINVADLLKQ